MSENSPTTLQAPSRDEIRHRRLAKKAKFRRRFFVVPVICVGLAMMGAGAYIMITGGSIGGPPQWRARAWTEQPRFPLSQ